MLFHIRSNEAYYQLPPTESLPIYCSLFIFSSDLNLNTAAEEKITKPKATKLLSNTHYEKEAGCTVINLKGCAVYDTIVGCFMEAYNNYPHIKTATKKIIATDEDANHLRLIVKLSETGVSNSINRQRIEAIKPLCRNRQRSRYFEMDCKNIFEAVLDKTITPFFPTITMINSCGKKTPKSRLYINLKYLEQHGSQNIQNAIHNPYTENNNFDEGPECKGCRSSSCTCTYQFGEMLFIKPLKSAEVKLKIIPKQITFADKTYEFLCYMDATTTDEHVIAYCRRGNRWFKADDLGTKIMPSAANGETTLRPGNFVYVLKP